MSTRIENLKADLFKQTREISLERALLYIESHKQTEGEPTQPLLEESKRPHIF